MKILYSPTYYSQQRQHEKKRNIWPVVMAMEATKMRNDGHEVFWNDTPDVINKVLYEPEGLPFLDLPHPDRRLTDAFNPKYQNNGNFKHHPGTYIQSASGCWHGKCSFCVEKDKPYEVRPYHKVVEEIEECERLGFREVFDDSATFPTGDWLDSFLDYMIDLDLGISLGCNMRFGTHSPYEMMKDAGFRMVLYGLESANQETLDRVNKGISIDMAISELMYASKCGLEPHICVIFGYPWETDAEAERTLKLVHYLLRKGYAKTAQASFYTVPDNVENIDVAHHAKYIPQIYRAAFYPDFWINKLKDIKNVDDIKYIWRGIKSCFGK